MSDVKKVKCPFCKKYFKWTHLCLTQYSGKKRDYIIVREFVESYKK